jgi:hypothetical protein
MTDGKRYELKVGINVVRDAEKDPIGDRHDAGKRFTAAQLKAAGVDEAAVKHLLAKGALVEISGTGGSDDGQA